MAKVEVAERVPDLWRALANDHRRRLLDLLAEGPRTTGELAESIPSLSRFAVMQHLGVLADADLVIVRRRGRQRFNYLNPVPLRRWYERWVVPLASSAAAELLELGRHLDVTTVQKENEAMTTTTREEVRTVRIAAELRFRATRERVFHALTEETLEWFPHSYGGDRTKAVVVEPRVGGTHYEDWGDGTGHLYGHVTVFDPPARLCLRGRVTPGSILDTEYVLEQEGDETVLSVSKVAVGPMTEEEAEGIRTFGDTARFAEALRRLVERP